MDGGRAGDPGPGATGDRPARGGVGRAGPLRVVDGRGRGLRRRPRRRPGRLRVGGGRELLGRPPDLRAARRPRRSRWARASCGRTGGPWPRRRPWPRASGGTRPSGVAPASRSTGGAGRRQDRLDRRPSAGPAGRQRLAAVAAGPGRLAADRGGAHRRHAGLADRPLRHRWRGGPRAGRRGRRQAAPGGAPGPRGRGPAGGARRRAGAAAGDPGGDRGRGPASARSSGPAPRSSGPMVSWGTTANVSVPTGTDRPDPPPAGAVVSRCRRRRVDARGRALGGRLLPGLAGRVCGRDSDDLARLAADSPPGARGVVAVPWLDGARAPWWRDDARAGFVGLASAHDAGDLARAVLESVAWEVERCLVAVTSGPAGRPAGGRPHPGGCGDRRPALGGRPHRGHRAARHPPALGRGGLGRGRACWRPSAHRPRGSPSTSSTRSWPRSSPTPPASTSTGRCARWPTGWPGAPRPRARRLVRGRR